MASLTYNRSYNKVHRKQNKVVIRKDKADKGEKDVEQDDSQNNDTSNKQIGQRLPSVGPIKKNIDETNDSKDTSFVLKKAKTSGNYSILRKIILNGRDTLQRIKYTIYNAYLPFGREEYNDNTILNAIVNDSNNLNYNMLFTLNRIVKTFNELNTIDTCKHKYNIGNKHFFSFMREVQPNIDTINETICDENGVKISGDRDTRDTVENTVRQYSIRLYFKYGAKITHAKFVGELSPDQLKGKVCNINIDLGSMWVNDSTMMYGINIYITHITVLN